MKKILCGIFVFATLSLVVDALDGLRHGGRGGDLALRYNESLCAHTGINPFHVWNRDVTVRGFKGLPRPDHVFEKDASKRVVHAYPPWHMTYTWFYGKVPFKCVGYIVLALYGVALTALFQIANNLSPARDKVFYWSWLSFCLLPPIVSCIVWGNYGILCAGLLIIMVCSLEKGSQIIAGIAWGLMMVKPQIATLCIFPLLFQKKYKSVVVAVVLCLVATLWPAYVYGESPLALILQVPQIGSPYDTSVFRKLLPQSVVPFVKGIWILVCVLFCGYFSWLWRSAKVMAFRFAPVAFLFPIWLYSQLHDSVVAWPFFILAVHSLVRTVCGTCLHRAIFCYFMLLSVTALFSGAWRICTAINLIDTTVIGWVYPAINFPAVIVHFIIGCWILLKGPSVVESTNGIVNHADKVP